MTDEQLELMRIAAQRVVDDTNTGMRGDPFALAWALHVVAHVKPLGRPLGPGDQAPVNHQPASRAPAHFAAHLEAW